MAVVVAAEQVGVVTTETTKAVVAARLNVGLVRRVKTRDVDSAKQYKQQLKTWLEEDVKEGQVSPDETGHIGLFHAVESGMGSLDETMTTGSELNATVLALQTLIQRSRKVCVIHVGGTRCVTSSTDHSMNIRARITWTVECIRTCIFVVLCYV
jgi:hypothetical protein